MYMWKSRRIKKDFSTDIRSFSKSVKKRVKNISIYMCKVQKYVQNYKKRLKMIQEWNKACRKKQQ